MRGYVSPITKITMLGGFEADVRAKGSGSIQVVCDKLNATHFGGVLPAISTFAITRFQHPTKNPLHAIALRTEESPELTGIEIPWAILIHENYCDLPEVAQLLLHEMTHILLPDENPFHSARFWATLREKWMLDMELVLGVGLNADEAPTGLTKEILGLTRLCQLFGI